MQRLLVHSLAPNMRDVDIIYLFPPGCPPIVEIARESPTARKATVSFATEARSVPDSNCRLMLATGRKAGVHNDMYFRRRRLCVHSTCCLARTTPTAWAECRRYWNVCKACHVKYRQTIKK
jgi:hypothetical protein